MCIRDSIAKRVGDKKVRKGVTEEPLVSEDLNFVSPLHVYLRVWDFLFKLIVRLKVPFYSWEDSKFSRMKPMIDQTRKDCIQLIRDNAGEKVEVADPTGFGGTSTTGPVIKRLLRQKVEVLVSLVPETHQGNLKELVVMLDVLMSAYSSSRSLSMGSYKELVGRTYDILLVKLRGPDGKPWVYPSPTVHSFLSHSAEILEENGCFGVGSLSEQGLENNNRLLRFFRKSLARKCSQEANLHDCFTRLWLQSDPIIRRSGRTAKTCSRCGDGDHFTVSCPSKEQQTTSRIAPTTLRETLMKKLLI